LLNFGQTIRDKSEVKLGTSWGTFWKPHENMMRTHWEQWTKKKSLFRSNPTPTHPNRKKMGSSWVLPEPSHWLPTSHWYIVSCFLAHGEVFFIGELKQAWKYVVNQCYELWEHVLMRKRRQMSSFCHESHFFESQISELLHLVNFSTLAFGRLWS
jgi:hypothetical protein